MNTAKTVIMTMIVAFAMIGMTGIAMAGSTVYTSGDEGSYSTQWHGSNIDVSIHTYTANGEDHLQTAGRFGGGSQTMDDGAWTRINRGVGVFGADAYIYADTIDNSDDGVSVGASTDFGIATLTQNVQFRDGSNKDVVKSLHGMSAYAWYGDANAYSATFTPNTATLVDVTTDGVVYLGAEAKAFTKDTGREKSEQKQIFVTAFGDGDGYIGAVGDDKVKWDLTIYQNGAYTKVFDNTGPISVDHISEFSRDYCWYTPEYRATGYIYAVSAS